MLEEEQVLGQASTDVDLGPLPDLGPDLEYFLQELATMQERVILPKDHGQKTMRTRLSGGGALLIHRPGGGN